MARAYFAEYACGNRVSLANAADPPDECPNCGAELVEGYVHD